MSKVRVSAVKYTNSIPFIYGLQNYSLDGQISLSLDTPAQCYNNLLCGKADIGLVPVVFKNEINSLKQVSSYGIGAKGDVYSVILVSPCPLNQVKTIYLDYQSRTSVLLTRLLCRDYWKINPEFVDTKPGFENKVFKPEEARLVIGDRAFRFHEQKNIYITDLAGEWAGFSGLPFVFAIWASVRKLNPVFEGNFIEALNFGMAHKARLIIEMASQSRYKSIDLGKYLNENIIHEINPSMQEGMNLFLHLIRDFRF
jgi:chorismate dehydratase